MKHKAFATICLLSMLLFLTLQTSIFTKIRSASALPVWPSSWVLIDSDKNENGASDDMRDVRYAYYQFDADYLFLKLTCYGLPGGEWPHSGARYKWSVDLDGDMYYSGGNIFNAEYLLFVEDADLNGFGETYLLYEANNDGNFGEYEPWPPTNYVNYRITDPNVGNFRIVGPYDIEMYIGWTSIGTPSSYQLFWATDQQNPNLDQGPSSDRVDEEQPIAIQNIAAISQTAVPAVVRQGENVAIQVIVENKGTLAETFNVTSYFNNSAIDTKLVTGLSAGHQSTLTYNWNTTGIPEGVYAISAWADSSAKIAETNETDNWCTYPATVTIQPAPIHDVAAVSQVPDQISVVQGTVVNVNVTVLNLGDFTETFNVTCLYGDVPIDFETITSMAEKTSMNVVFAWNTSEVGPDLYYVRAMADSSRIIAESDENNNNCTSLEVVTVYSPSQMGKLVVDKSRSFVVSGEDPPVIGQTTTYELTLIITNIGGSNLVNVKVNDTLSSQVSFRSVGIPSQGVIVSVPPPKLIWSVGTLAPGDIANLTFRVSVTPSSLDTLYLNHKEDLVGSGVDILGHSVAAVGRTDIVEQPIVRDVAATSQIPADNIVPQGDTTVIQVTVNNNGNVTETFDVTCYYDSNEMGVMRVYNLEAGESYIVTFPWDTTGIPTGTYSIEAETDSSGEIAESSESNNICTSPATVRIVIYDIALLSQTPSPVTLIQGETVTIQVSIKNEGSESATFNVSCYLNSTFIEKKLVSDLQPDQTTTVEFVYETTGVTPGRYYVNAYTSIIAGEKDTIDNACRSTVSIDIASPSYRVVFTQNGLDSSATGIVLIVNGSSKTFLELPYTVHAAPGAVITYAYQNVTSNIAGKGFLLTTLSGSPSPITITGNMTVTGNYRTQYLLMVTTIPPALAPSPSRNPSGIGSPSGWWYDASSTVTLTSQSVSGYKFAVWIVDGEYKGNGVNPVSVTMDGPHSASANYTAIPVVPVGGYSLIAPAGSTSQRITVYAILICLFCALLSTLNRKRK